MHGGSLINCPGLSPWPATVLISLHMHPAHMKTRTLSALPAPCFGLHRGLACPSLHWDSFLEDEPCFPVYSYLRHSQTDQAPLKCYLCVMLLRTSISREAVRCKFGLRRGKGRRSPSGTAQRWVCLPLLRYCLSPVGNLRLPLPYLCPSPRIIGFKKRVNAGHRRHETEFQFKGAATQVPLLCSSGL